jgi:hypothetical protein
MAMPVTRPINRTSTTFQQGALPRPAAPMTLALPPSNGTRLPRGAGVLHTVKNPAHQVPTTPRVAPAAVS